MARGQISASAVYAVGNLARGGALLALTPFLVNSLTTDEYGRWALSEVVILLATMVMVAGLDIGLMREYWQLPSEKRRAETLGLLTVAVMVSGMLWFVVGLGLGTGGALDLGTGNETPWVLALASAWTESVMALFLAHFRIREDAWVFAGFSVGRSVALVALAILLIHMGYGVTGGLLGRFIAGTLALGGALVLVASRRQIAFAFDKGILSRVARYGLPLLPANLASYVLLASDRYFIGGMIGLKAVAVYSFAYKVGSTLDMLVIRPYSADWAARRFKIAGETDAERHYDDALLLYLEAGTAFSLFAIALTPLGYQFLAPEVYSAGMAVVPVILLAYLVYGAAHPLNVGLMLKDRTRFLAYGAVIAAAACIALNVRWIPQFGMSGAAWATVVSYAIYTALVALGSLSVYPIRYSFRRIVAVIVPGLLGLLALYGIQTLFPPDALLLKTLCNLGVAVPIGLLIFRRHVRSGLDWIRQGFEVRLTKRGGL